MMLYYVTWLMFFIRHNSVIGITCFDVLEMPEDKYLSMYDLQTLQAKEIIACLTHLGRKKMSINVAEFIWHSIVKYYDGVLNIPENVLTQLGWVTTAVKPEEYANMTLSSIDVIRNFGQDYNLNDLQLSAIADRVREDFASKEPEDYTFFDLKAIRQVLCVFNRSEIERIHPSAYREAALVIGKLNRCRSEVMKGFTALAVQKDAFGPPENWTKAILTEVGQIHNYLPKNVMKTISEGHLLNQSFKNTTAEPPGLLYTLN